MCPPPPKWPPPPMWPGRCADAAGISRDEQVSTQETTSKMFLRIEPRRTKPAITLASLQPRRLKLRGSRELVVHKCNPLRSLLHLHQAARVAEMVEAVFAGN